MAETVGLASGILTLSVFAFKSSSKLHRTIQELGGQPRQIRDILTELTALNLVLRELTETGDISLGVDLSALKLTLEQCKRACDEVATELQPYCTRSDQDKARFRDWVKLKWSSGDGMEGFRQQLIGYKSTIVVALSFANLRASANTTEAIRDCRDLISLTIIDLEAHLQDIQARIDRLSPSATDGVTPDGTVLQRIEEEKRSTAKGLQFCAVLSQQIEQIQADYLEDDLSSSDRDPSSTSRVLVGEGLGACRNHVRFTLDQLEMHRKRMEDLGASSEVTVSPQDRALFDKLQSEVNTLRQSLGFCSDVDAVLESHISNIENHAEGDDTIQFMVSTDGKPVNGKNRGIGQRLKQAGGHFGETALQSMSQDFKTISIHQAGPIQTGGNGSTSVTGDDGTSAEFGKPFSNRHGPGFTLAKHPTPPKTSTSVDT